ncbi:MAG: hypothetical protein ACR5LF_02435 [Symbiopectobacterium sp.]
MAKTHRTHQTPYIASLVQGAFMLCATALFTLAQLDPMALGAVRPDGECFFLGFCLGQHVDSGAAIQRLARRSRLLPA